MATSVLQRLVASTVLVIVLLLPGAESRAGDMIQLTTGEILSGKILRVNDKEVSIKLESGGIITFKAHNVSKVKRWWPGKNIPEVIFFENPDPIDTDNFDKKGLPVPHNGMRPPRLGDPDSFIPKFVRDWHLEPPPGFEVALPKKMPEALRVWIDPIVQAKVILSAYSSDSILPEKLKDSTLKELNASKKTRVIRNQAVQRGGEGGYKGWILEVEHNLEGKPIHHQLQLYTRANNKTFVLNFTCPSSDYPALARFFEDSLQSFRVFDNTKKATAKKSASRSS